MFYHCLCDVWLCTQKLYPYGYPEWTSQIEQPSLLSSHVAEYEAISHVLLPVFYHLPNFPTPVLEVWMVKAKELLIASNLFPVMISFNKKGAPPSLPTEQLDQNLVLLQFPGEFLVMSIHSPMNLRNSPMSRCTSKLLLVSGTMMFSMKAHLKNSRKKVVPDTKSITIALSHIVRGQWLMLQKAAGDLLHSILN